MRERTESSAFRYRQENGRVAKRPRPVRAASRKAGAFRYGAKSEKRSDLRETSRIFAPLRLGFDSIIRDPFIRQMALEFAAEFQAFDLAAELSPEELQPAMHVERFQQLLLEQRIVA